MKKIIETNESGFEALLGKTVTLFCVNYFYTGTLAGVNDAFVMLENPSIVYETGPFSDPKWKDAQELPGRELFVMKSAIEAFGIVK